MEKIAELRTPITPRLEPFIEKIVHLDAFDSILLADGGGLDKIVLAAQIQAKTAKKIYLKIACSDKSRIAIYSALLTAASLGFSRVVVADGPHPLTTRFPSAKPVYDLDAYSLLRILKEGIPRLSNDAPPLKEITRWTVGICIGGETKPDIIRAEKSLAVGADIIFARSQVIVARVKQLTKRPVFLTVPAAQTHGLATAVDLAMSAGADGVHVIFDDDGE